MQVHVTIQYISKPVDNYLAGVELEIMVQNCRKSFIAYLHIIHTAG